LGNLLTLKFRITSQKDFSNKDGNPRPEYQIPVIKKIPAYRNNVVSYRILMRYIPNRLAAKAIEQKLRKVLAEIAP
jgi:hypothetical protein